MHAIKSLKKTNSIHSLNTDENIKSDSRPTAKEERERY